MKNLRKEWRKAEIKQGLLFTVILICQKGKHTRAHTHTPTQFSTAEHNFITVEDQAFVLQD